MKKWALFLLTIVVLTVLAACGSKDEGTKEKADAVTTLKVGTVPQPHAEILDHIKEDLKKDGVELEYVMVNSGRQTNEQTAQGDLDVNYFQHVPYMELINKEAGIDLVSVVNVHIEPIGVYSTKIKDIKELKEGAKISLSSDAANFSRVLQLFASNGLIELAKKEGTYTVDDITKNDKNLKFIGVQAEMLNRTVEDVDAAAIATNYALEAGFVPNNDALILEGTDTDFANILTARKDNKDSKAVKTLAKWLTSDKTKKFIEEKYEGAVIPAF
ncbi:methionine ABC transporter substrate-binding protein [Viridibacillus sp. YIM B01967]|uniref:Lipoprotein n=1 Tax=Viridibacillus soli TaxID=2798301 RepID=A0ABS1H6K2_9BACL|nr:MetQ/NlpA family ABC transporter substrate-binding protein [Viridibacillus soli]MBK3494772.1 methionine ABC transporter substrate-binding protein [Viridibacillus soli]